VSWLALGPLGGRAQIQASASASGLSPNEVTETLVFGADGVTPTSTWWWLATDAPHTGTPLALAHTTGTAIALLGAMLLLGHVTAPVARALTGAVLAPLAAAGSMTLTLYTAHIMFLNSPLDVYDATPSYLLQITAALGFVLVWSATMGRGPLERVVTALAPPRQPGGGHFAYAAPPTHRTKQGDQHARRALAGSAVTRPDHVPTGRPDRTP
jgi:hypothetical protein